MVESRWGLESRGTSVRGIEQTIGHAILIGLKGL